MGDVAPHLDNGPFNLETHTLSDGKTTFSVPADAIPEIKQVLLAVVEHQILPDDQKSEEWRRWGHRIVNVVNILMTTGLNNDPPEIQRQKLADATEELIQVKGAEIGPYLLSFGFPRVE